MRKIIAWSREREAAIVPVLLVLCTIAFGLWLASYMTRSTVFAADEAYYRDVIRYYANRELTLQTLREDWFSRGFARLYMILYSPLFAHYEAYTAIRLSKLFNCLLFVSTSFPTYLLARSIALPRWRALAASLLSIAVPWITLTAPLMTESLCYPLFIWIIFCMFQSFHKPAWYWDFLAASFLLLGATTRAQFLGLIPAYLLLIILREVKLFRAGVNAGLVKYLGGTLYRTPLAIVAFTALGYVFVTGRALQVFNSFAGSYQEFATRKTTPVNMVLSAGAQTSAMALGTGLVAVIVGGSWYCGLLSTRRKSRDRDFAIVVAVATVIMFGFTLLAQGQYWLEERYYFYSVPLLWVGVFASLQQKVFARKPALLIVVFISICVAITSVGNSLNQTTMFMIPATSHVSYYVSMFNQSLGSWLGLTASLLSLNDLLVLIVLLFSIINLYFWCSESHSLKHLSIGFAAVVQFLLIAAAFNSFNGITPLTSVSIESTAALKKRAWIDQAGTKPKSVFWANNGSLVSGFDRTTDEVMQTYWNSNISAGLLIPGSLSGADPSFVGFFDIAFHSAEVADRGGFLRVADQGLSQTKFAVQSSGSPHFQLAGSRISVNSDGRLELVRLALPLRAVWSTRGLNSLGFVPMNGKVKLRFRPISKGSYLVRFLLENPSIEPMQLKVKLGHWGKVVTLSPQSKQASRQNFANQQMANWKRPSQLRYLLLRQLQEWSLVDQGLSQLIFFLCGQGKVKAVLFSSRAVHKLVLDSFEWTVLFRGIVILRMESLVYVE